MMLSFAMQAQQKSSLKVSKVNRFDAIVSGFTQIPDSIQTSVYWYWISDNISKEGVVKDLYAMKKAGINRAFIGNIGNNAGLDNDLSMFQNQQDQSGIKPVIVFECKN